MEIRRARRLTRARTWTIGLFESLWRIAPETAQRVLDPQNKGLRKGLARALDDAEAKFLRNATAQDRAIFAATQIGYLAYVEAFPDSDPRGALMQEDARGVIAEVEREVFGQYEQPTPDEEVIVEYLRRTHPELSTASAKRLYTYIAFFRMW